MAKHLHADLETFSEIDLRDVGAYRYAFDKSTCILCAAFAFDQEEPIAWQQGEELPQDVREALLDPTVLIYAHHAAFEMAVLQALIEKTWGIPCPDLSRFRCTMSLARRAALPSKLETLAEVLGLSNQKDKRGKSLINKFSVMQKGARVSKKNPEGGLPFRIYPKDDPEAFAEFVEYCRQDVRAEQEVATRLAYFDEPINNANYSLDARINARGVPVNLTALRHAQKLIEEETEIVSAAFRELTGFEVTQNAVLLKWVNDNGCPFENLQAETVDGFLAPYETGKIRFYIHPESECHWITLNEEPDEMDPNVEETTEEQYLKAAETFGGKCPWLVVLALRLKQSIAYASIKKVKTMLDCAGPHDNRIRGMLNHHGAGTGRWTASLVQPQNLKRPTIKHTEEAYRDIEAGMSREMVELCYGPVLEVISSSVRHFFEDQPNNIFDGDYSSVEARIVNWLAGQEDALERFRRYDAASSSDKKSLDPYRIMAADVYRIPVHEVEPFPHRFVGKGLVLGAGYKLSGDGFRRQCLEQAKYEMSEDAANHAIDLWRSKHKKVVDWWADLDKASKKAIVHKGEVFHAGKIRFCCKEIKGTLFLLMKLPSGRNIAYPRPKIVPGKFANTTQIEYFGNIKGAMWGSCRLWAGVLANNATQGTAADVMFAGSHNCENAGYDIFTVVHDQALGFVKPGQTGKRFVELLTKMPAWANGLPLAAEGGEAPFYRKS